MINAYNLSEFYNTNGYAPHSLIDEFLTDKAYNTLLDEFPSNNLFKNEFPETRKLGQRPHRRRFMCYYETKQSSYFDEYKIDLKNLSEIWQELCTNLMHGWQYKEWICETLKIKDFVIRYDWHRTADGLDVSPHIDSAGKYGSHLFYFMPPEWKDEYGGKTIFYKDKTVDKMNPETSDFKESVSYPVIGNKSLLFKNADEGWHGVTQVTNNIGLHRQLFNVVILRTDI